MLSTSAAAAVWFALRTGELGSIDQALRTQAENLAPGLTEQNGAVSFDGGASLPADIGNGLAIAVEVVDRGGGRVLATTGTSLPATAARQVVDATAVTDPALLDVDTPQGSARALGARLDGAPTFTLVLFHPLSDTEDTLRRVALLLGGADLLLVAVASALGYHLAGRALRPVEEITALARDISEHDLHRRLGLELPPDELGRLAGTLDGMLDRLERSFLALQRFTADAAHELRAPLTLMRSELEVGLRRPRSGDADAATMQAVLTEVTRLADTADRLLLLARADAGALSALRAPVDLVDLAEECADRWRTVAAQRDVRLEVSAEPVARVSGDADLLRHVLDNLVDNAIRHGPAGSVVTIRVALSVGTGVLTVRDQGPGFTADARAHAFERFTRGDAQRRRDDGGAGLGLALCAAIVAAHGGSIAIGAGPGGEVVVRLPAESR